MDFKAKNLLAAKAQSRQEGQKQKEVQRK